MHRSARPLERSPEPRRGELTLCSLEQRVLRPYRIPSRKEPPAVSAKLEALQLHEKLKAEYEQRMQHLATRTDLPAYIWRADVEELFDVSPETVTNWINYKIIAPAPGTENTGMQFSRSDVQTLATTYRKSNYRPYPSKRRGPSNSKHYRTRPASESTGPVAERHWDILTQLSIHGSNDGISSGS